MLDLNHISKFDFERRKRIYQNTKAWEIVFSETTRIINGLTIRIQEASEEAIQQTKKRKGSWSTIFSQNANAEELFGNTQAVIWAIQSK